MEETRPWANRLGRLLQWMIQTGIGSVGKRHDLSKAPWLDGPLGGNSIGAGYYERFAAQAGLDLHYNAPDSGLLGDFTCLKGSRFDPLSVDLEIRRFYERTADYEMEVWSEWSGLLKPFASMLVSLVSPLMQQLNLPVSPLATSRGVSSDVISFLDRQSGGGRYTGWLRSNVATKEVIYAGFYTVCTPPGHRNPCVKVVFPVPRGASIVILRPQNQRDGSFKLISRGKGFGDPGFYRVHQPAGAPARIAYLPLHESFHVYRTDTGTLRTDHKLDFLGMQFLTLHYHIRRKN